MKYKTKIIVFLIFLLLGINSVFAEGTQVVTNSLDWHDVYSAGVFAALNGYKYNYVIEETQGLEVIQIMDSSLNDVVLINPQTNNFISGYKTSIEDRGFNIQTEITSNDYIDNNLELAELSGVNSFVIVDDAYGYNAISVAAYASKTGSFVLFVNPSSVDRVIDMIDGADSVLLYGPMDRTVREELAPYSTDTINLGNKYLNNQEVLRRISQIEPISQIILTNGEVLEPEILDGFKPTLLIGSTNVPESVTQFIINSGVQVGVLIGDGIHQNALTIRETTGIQVFLKFAKGINQVKRALDIMPVDVFNSNISVQEIRYNINTNQFEAILKNHEDNFAYARISLQIIKDGDIIATLGGEVTDFFSNQEILTKLYDYVLDDPDASYIIEYVILYGEEETGLEKLIRGTIPLNFVDVLDDSSVEIDKIEYNQDTKRFEITVNNLGSDDVYARAKFLEFSLGGETTNLASTQYQISPKGSSVLKIRVDMEQIDFEDNENINVELKYGATSENLIKTLRGTYTYTVKDSLDILVPVAIGLGGVMVTLVVVTIIFGRRR